MRITEEQTALIRSLRCERLASNIIDIYRGCSQRLAIKRIKAASAMKSETALQD